MPEDFASYSEPLVRDRTGHRSAMEAHIRRLADQARHNNGFGGRSRLYRIALPIPPVAPLAWIRAQSNGVKLYWCGRDDSLEIAGVGFADRFSEHTSTDYKTVLWRLRSVMADGDEGIRYYGGMRFDHTRPVDDAWDPFGSYLFYLPRFEVHTLDGASKLICNLAFPRDLPKLGDILNHLNRLVLDVPASNGGLPLPVARHDAPDLDGWTANVNRALAAFASGSLEKVVLARKATFSFARPLDPLQLLQHLKEATPHCFHFAFQPDAERALIGASPERLYERMGQSIWSEAIAGTRPRGDSAQDDDWLAQELLSSEKDRREHEYVRRSIIDRVGPLSTSYRIDTEPSVMQLANGQHLQAKFKGTLRSDVTDADLLMALHPTPAVGGFPRADALETIARLEPFDRGWYGGPVGWVGPDDAEFAVAIRSGLVYRNELALFSGAGIVDGSAPATEWSEIEQKITGFTNLFTTGTLQPAPQAARGT